MGRDFFDAYSRLNSPIHRVPAALKLIAVLALLVAIVNSKAALVPVAAILLAVAVISHIPASFLLKRLLLLEPLALGVALLALLQPGGGRIFALLVAKSTLCLTTMILLSSTTPFSEVLRVLRRVHVPALLITTLALMYRYLFVLVDEAGQMKRARACRSFVRQRRFRWRTLATVASQWLKGRPGS